MGTVEYTCLPARNALTARGPWVQRWVKMAIASTSLSSSASIDGAVPARPWAATSASARSGRRSVTRTRPTSGWACHRALKEGANWPAPTMPMEIMARVWQPRHREATCDSRGSGPVGLGVNIGECLLRGHLVGGDVLNRSGYRGRVLRGSRVERHLLAGPAEHGLE